MANKYSRKMLIETLSIAQSRIAESPYDRHRKNSDIERLQYLIDELEKCEKCNGTRYEEYFIAWDNPYPERAMRPCTACKNRFECKTCKDRGYVPDWKNWNDYLGEPQPKACPDCEKGKEYGEGS